MGLSAEAVSLAAELNKRLGEGSVILASDMRVARRYTSGSLSLDVALGGGWPGNQWAEVLGMESHGKALDVETPIPTPTGWTSMGKLQPGDQVFDETGTACNVVFATEVQLDRVCYRVEFSDGSSLVADADHQWTVVEKSAGSRMTQHVVTTQYMVDTGLSVTAKNLRRFHIPTTQSLQYTEVLGYDAVPPYTLGAWLGDGTSAGGGFTSAEEEIVESIRADGFEVNKHKDSLGTRPFSWGIQKLAAQLGRLGVLGAKHIPEAYLRAPVEDRLALLQGLMDTDGYSDRRGHCEYTSTNRRLAEGVYELLIGLGHKVHWGEGEATLNGRFISTKYRLTFQSDLPVFRLTRKALRAAEATAGRRVYYMRGIVAIEPVVSRPVKCIQVDSPSSLYLAGQAAIPTHNTAIVLKTIAANQALDPDFSTLWIAAEHYDVDQAAALGVDNSRVVVVPTQEMEVAYETMLKYASARAVDCVVLDSYPALIPKEEEEKSMDEAVMALGARLTGKFFRKAGSATRRSLIGLDRPMLGFIINQYRDKIGAFAPHGTPKTSPGGHAKNYAFYTRVEVTRDEWIEQATPGKGKIKVGQKIKVRTVKNKSAAPQQVAYIDFYFRDAPVLGFERGEYDITKELVAMALVYDVITRGGATFRFGDHKWNGKDPMFKAIREDVALCNKIAEHVREVALDPLRQKGITETDLSSAQTAGVRTIQRRHKEVA